MPGRYQTNEKLYIERDCSSDELEALVCFNPADNIDELNRSKILLKTKEIKAKVATILEELPSASQKRACLSPLFGDVASDRNILC